MSVIDAPALTKRFRTAVLISGILTALFGVAILVWPTKAAAAVTALIAVYAVVVGLVYLGIGIAEKALSVGSRVGHALLGLLYAFAGVVAFTNLQQTAGVLAVFLTVMIGFMWIFEGFVALFTLADGESKVLTILFAIISILAGISLASSPLWGALFLWWFLGISLVVLGALNVVRALGNRSK